MLLPGLGAKGLGEGFQGPDEVPGQDPGLRRTAARTRPEIRHRSVLAGEDLGPDDLALIEDPIQEVRNAQGFDRLADRSVVARRKPANVETSSS